MHRTDKFIGPICGRIEHCASPHLKVLAGVRVSIHSSFFMVKVATKHVTCGLRFSNAVFAVISFSAASNRSPTQVHPTVSENIGEDVASVERIIETTIASQDVEANPEVGSFTHCVSTTFITIFYNI